MVDFKWNSANGASVSRGSGSPASDNGTLRIYKDNSTTERSSSAGITDTENFDSLVGVHHCRIDLSDNTDAGFYAAGHEYQVVLVDAEVDGMTPINAVIAHFTVEASSIYQAKAWLQDDNNGSNDRYIVCWLKNGEPIFSGITSPTIQVIKAADGTDLVASTSMTQIAATGMYRYNEGSNRVVDGAGYIIKAQATINGATRTWVQPIGRDS